MCVTDLVFHYSPYHTRADDTAKGAKGVGDAHQDTSILKQTCAIYTTM